MWLSIFKRFGPLTAGYQQVTCLPLPIPVTAVCDARGALFA